MECLSARFIVKLRNMVSNKNIVKLILMLVLPLVAACSVSYKFNGSSIDYTKTKTISIATFPNRAAYVWAPMASIFNNELVDEYSKKTRLQQVRRNGDLQISGEITEYTQSNKSVSADGYSSQVELKMTVNVRFVNNSNHSEDFERTFSASQTYDSSQPLTSVQDDLVNQMVKDITNQIFNATVANW